MHSRESIPSRGLDKARDSVFNHLFLLRLTTITTSRDRGTGAEGCCPRFFESVLRVIFAHSLLRGERHRHRHHRHHHLAQQPVEVNDTLRFIVSSCLHHIQVISHPICPLPSHSIAIPCHYPTFDAAAVPLQRNVSGGSHILYCNEEKRARKSGTGWVLPFIASPIV